jgi:hypothetical protein
VAFASERRPGRRRRAGLTLAEVAAPALLVALLVSAAVHAAIDLSSGDQAVPAHHARRARAEAVSAATIGGPMLELRLNRGGGADESGADPLLAADLSGPSAIATVDVTVAEELAARMRRVERAPAPVRDSKPSR